MLVLMSVVLLLRTPPETAAAEAVGESLHAEWDHLVMQAVTLRDLPSRLLADAPTCDPPPVSEGAAAPTVKFVEAAATPNKFAVRVEHASCAWIDFDQRHARDTHFVWTVPEPLVHVGPHWFGEHLWASHTQTLPWTLTAVGPGGVTVLEGEHTFRRGDG